MRDLANDWTEDRVQRVVAFGESLLRCLGATALLALVACQSAPPQPFPDGAPARPPQGCESLRERGGEC